MESCLSVEISRKDRYKRKQATQKRKGLAKGLYCMKVSNAIGIDGEKGDALSETLIGYHEKYWYPTDSGEKVSILSSEMTTHCGKKKRR